MLGTERTLNSTMSSSEGERFACFGCTHEVSLKCTNFIVLLNRAFCLMMHYCRLTVRELCACKRFSIFTSRNILQGSGVGSGNFSSSQ